MDMFIKEDEALCRDEYLPTIMYKLSMTKDDAKELTNLMDFFNECRGKFGNIMSMDIDNTLMDYEFTDLQGDVWAGTTTIKIFDNDCYLVLTPKYTATDIESKQITRIELENFLKGE